MYDSVKAAFVPFSGRFEGTIGGFAGVPWPYVDVKNLVTTGLGYLCDDLGTFHSIPWKIGSGTGPLASSAEVDAGYNAVKNAGASQWGGGNQAGLSNLRLSAADIDDLTARKLATNEPNLRRYYPSYDNMPADGQLLLHSLSWALGSAFSPEFPSFTRAVNAITPDWKTAALQSWMKDTRDGWTPKSLDDDYNAHPADANPGLRARNISNRQLALNAFNATQAGTPFDQLWWPSTTGGSSFATASLSRFTLSGALKTFGIVAGVAAAGIGVNMAVTGDSLEKTLHKAGALPAKVADRAERFAHQGMLRVKRLV